MTRPAFRVLAVLALGAGLSGCLSARVPDAVEDARTPTEQFVAKVVSAPEEIRLAVHAQGLSANQSDALAAFVDAWRDGGGPIRVQAPSGSGPDAAAAYRTAEGARARLIALGVPAAMVELAGYHAADEPGAPVVVGYLRHQVDLPECGQRWTNLAHSAGNRVQPNFGCAVTANMTAQIANPGDLAAPRAGDPADAGRRQTVLDKYRKGEVTSAARNEQSNGAVSTAVQ